MTASARIVLLESQRALLERYVFGRDGLEGAAFLLCGEAGGACAPKLICHAVLPIDDEDYLRRDPDALTIQSRALVRIAKAARQEGLSVVFAHSHPFGPAHFSKQDDREELRLLPFLQARVPNRMHGTLVLTKNAVVGRIYAPDRQDALVVIVGHSIALYGTNGDVIQPIFDRQVRAFGGAAQQVLSSLHIGIVGLGGTGSPVAEQLVRLGVSALTLFDDDTFEGTNVNRVYGSSTKDEGELKVDIAKRHLDRIGLSTRVVAVPGSIVNHSVAQQLRACDVVFGCTDKHMPRAILTLLAIKYSLPVIDLGVVIDSQDGVIRGVFGRVTTLMPGEACLFCRGRISAEAMRVESLSEGERANQINEGYAPELDDPAPSVVAFTTAVAGLAVTELLHRLTGFMGPERASTELLIAFDQSRIRTNRVSCLDSCFCSDHAQWARGDENPFLGLAWPSDMSPT